MKIEHLEDVISNYFNVPKDVFWDKKWDKITSKAKSYLWYILHYDEKISSGKIAKRYGRTKRNVFITLSKIKFAIEKQKGYKKTYDDIYKNIREDVNPPL